MTTPVSSAVAPRPRTEPGAPLELLRARVDATADALERCVAELVEGARRLPRPAPGGEVVTTGIGLSEEPARLMVHALRERGQPARFVPISSLFARSRSRGLDARATRVVFSQGLSPNARVALQGLERVHHTLLVTACGSAGRPARDDARAALERLELHPRATVLRHAPATEEGLLLRVIGPMLASCAALVWTMVCAGGPTLEERRLLAALPARLRAIAGGPTLPEGWLDRLADPGDASSVALIATDGRDELCRVLAWRLQEGLWRPAPPVWDALAFAHGPLQAIHGRPALLLAPTFPEDPVGDGLLDRLERTLRPERHALVRLRATLPRPLGCLEHAMMINRLLLAALARAPTRDLSRWPGRGEDGPLYELADAGSLAAGRGA